MNGHLWLVGLAGLGSSAPMAAQTPTVLYRAGDAIGPQLGSVDDIGRFAINDHGEWLVVVTSDTLEDGQADVMLRNGVPTLQQGIVLAQPPGARLEQLGSVGLNDLGQSAWEFLIAPTAGEALDALYFGTALLALEGEPMDTPGYDPAAVWSAFDGATEIADGGRVLVACHVDDPSIPGAQDDALVLLRVDAAGRVLERTDVVHEGSPLDGRGGPVRGVATQASSIGLSNRGDVIYVASLEASNEADRAVFVNGSVVAREGDPAPIDGLVWRDLGGAAVDVNDRGQYGLRGRVTGSSARQQVIVRGSEVLARQRGAVPEVPGRVFLDFGEKAPIRLSNDGTLFYFGEINGDSAKGAGLFADRDLIVRQGETLVGDTSVGRLADSAKLFAISPAGRFLLFRAHLAGVQDEIALCLVDLGRATPLEGCGQNAGRLERRWGFPVAGGRTVLGMGDGVEPGRWPFLMIASQPSPGRDGCGTIGPFGELLIAFGATTNDPIDVLLGEPWSGEGPVEIPLDLPSDPALVGMTLYAQGAFFDIGDRLPGPALRLTNALEIEVGAP